MKGTTRPFEIPMEMRVGAMSICASMHTII